jgi:hypothetical protein
MLITGNGQKEPFEPTNICSECASFVKLIASIEDPAVILKILAHLVAFCRGPYSGRDALIAEVALVGKGNLVDLSTLAGFLAAISFKLLE